MKYDFLLTLHITSVILLLGVGGGSAFYKFMADRSKNLDVILHTNKIVVLVDWIFTTPSVLMQPITGVMLVNALHIPFTTTWIYYSILLYSFSIILWIIAVYLQIKMKHIAIDTKKNNQLLKNKYFLYVKYWVILGIFSSISMIIIFILMIFKP